MSHSSPGARRRTPDPRLPVRAGRLLRVRTIWVATLVVGSLVVAAMAALYIASATDPLAHLSGLPVAVVNQDRAPRPEPSGSRSVSRSRPACWPPRR